MKPIRCNPVFIERAFEWHKEGDKRSHDLGDLDVPNKQNKQGVCHTRTLPFALKIILRQKKNTQIFHHAKI
jgi:hypothetical protein